MTTAPKRRWFRFSLRTLFVVVTLFAVWLGWQLSVVRERKAVLRQIEQMIGAEEFSYDYSDLESNEADPMNPLGLGEFEYARVSAIRRLLGDATCLQLTLPQSLDAKSISRAERAFPEAELLIWKHDGDEQTILASRSSLFAPIGRRLQNKGTLFKTGLIEK